MSSPAVARAATGTEKVACVTGASGYIASWIVKLLLARGYTVRATVRDPDDTEKTAHLRAMDGAGDRLHLFSANLLEEGSFDAVVDGCHCVFHTASPVLPDAEDPQAELIDPALKGTLNVLSSCKKASVERVISKEIQKDIYLHEFLAGTPTYPNLSHELVNVKDVAMAHVLAYEVPSAKGRCAEDKPFVPKFQVSKDKIISLGIKLTTVETSIMETVDSLKQKGFVSF
ncbi:hypothetical protein ACQ4PT_008674 [Festuca glaucescens]